MFIKRLSPGVYDVFLGTQWDEWTRVRRRHWGLQVIAGNRLDRTVMQELNQRLGIV